MGRAPTLEEVIAVLKQHEAELRARGVTRLAVFGSVARGDATPDSDVDLVIGYDHEAHFSLLDLVGIQLDATDWLGRKTDVATWDGLKPTVAARVNVDAIDVF